MKKFILFFTIISVFLAGCSSKETGNDSETNLFLKINVNGTEFNEISLWGTGFGGADNCSNNGDLFLQFVGQVENSTTFIECNFVHFENLIDFSNTTKNIITNTRITDTNSLYYLTTEGIYASSVCNKNNDFSIVFEDKISKKYLDLKPNSNRTHNITKVEQVSEDAEAKQYIIEGTFNATFLNGSTSIPVNGNYRIKIDVFK